MRTELACLPCFYGQVKRTLQHAGVNGDRARSITRKASLLIEAASMDDVPARTTTLIHRMLRHETGTDPYSRVKDEYNRIALDLLPMIRRRTAAAADRLEASVRAAIAGNIIDFGIYDSVDIDKAIEESFVSPLSGDGYRSFVQAVDRAGTILYLCDNAGEIVFDRVLLEALSERGKRVVAAVKGSPVINDATRYDADAAGISAIAAVIDNGSDGIGTLLETCSPQFLDAYHGADLIISKGQANFETLLPLRDTRTFFLFKVKCGVVAGALGKENGSIVLMQNG